jgi:hypothetical protein
VTREEECAEVRSRIVSAFCRDAQLCLLDEDDDDLEGGDVYLVALANGRHVLREAVDSLTRTQPWETLARFDTRKRTRTVHLQASSGDYEAALACKPPGVVQLWRQYKVCVVLTHVDLYAATAAGSWLARMYVADRLGRGR